MSERPLHVLVEIPKGSRNKYEYDEGLKAIRLDRFLFSSVVYPLDYGMIPETLAADGDPLDAMVAVSEPTFPGCVIPVKPIALFKMQDEMSPVVAVCKAAEQKDVTVDGCDSREDALVEIEESRSRWRASRAD